MKVLFAGTSEFAVPSLRYLYQSYEVVAVLTIPDKPAGRGYKLTSSPVKVAAEELGIKIFQPENLKYSDLKEEISRIDCHLLIICAYGKIVPEEIFDAPPYGSIVVHPSLLPKYRGAAPIQRAIMNGETETGVSIIKVAKEVDAGDVLMQRKVTIDADESAGSLSQRLSVLSAQMLLEAVDIIRDRKDVFHPQQHSEATYAPPIQKSETRINWKDNTKKIHNLIRALNPKPGAISYVEGNLIKVWESKIISFSEGTSIPYGQIIQVNKDGALIKTGDSAILITKIQPAGGKKMHSYEYAKGHRFEEGMVLS
jgi:methionyl-tRNA formyltransferase